MKFLLFSSILAQVAAFGVLQRSLTTTTRQQSTKPLFVSTGNIGLGPAEDQAEQQQQLVEGVDYEVPNHEEYRTSRRSKLDEKCDEWFGSLLKEEGGGILGDLSENARTILTTPVELKNDVSL